VVWEGVGGDEGMVYLNQECIKGTFHRVEIHRKFTHTLEAIAYGYDLPRYSWFVAGVPIPATPNAKIQFNTPVTIPIPASGTSPGGATTTNELVEVVCTVNGNKLTIVVGPLPIVTPAYSPTHGITARPGNFQCIVRVQVVEDSAAAVPKILPVITQDIVMSFPCLHYSWGVDYALAYERCYPTVSPLKDTGVWTYHVGPSDPEPYFVAPEELVEVLKLESLARALTERSDTQAEHVVEYMVGRYNLPKARVLERIKLPS
jgi:hypothetical protein